MVALASDRWAMLDPLSREARELAAGSRLREGDYVGAEYQLGRLLELSSADQAEGWRTVMALLAPSNDKVRVNKVLDNRHKEFNAESNGDALFARSHLAALNPRLRFSQRKTNALVDSDRRQFLLRFGITVRHREPILFRRSQLCRSNMYSRSIRW